MFGFIESTHVTTARLFHYTDDDGFKAICAQPDWVFVASKPPGDHPVGAYFTTLEPATVNLAKKLRLPKEKLTWVFCFWGSRDLIRLDGNRGRFILFSPVEYTVRTDRQIFSGLSEEAVECLR